LPGIDGVVVDWYGRADCYDYKKLHENVVLLVNMVEKYQMKFLICYEDQSINTLVDQKVIPHASRVYQATNELKWLAEKLVPARFIRTSSRAASPVVLWAWWSE
jgi:hypothetical protein